MASFNKVILLGNLTRDVDIRYLASGQALAQLGMAVTHTWYDKASNAKKEETAFVDVTLWGKTAEVAAQYLAKGKQVLIEGRLKQESWDDKQTGQKRYKMTVVGESMTMVGNAGGQRPEPPQQATKTEIFNTPSYHQDHSDIPF